jgi:hypothetical protein
MRLRSYLRSARDVAAMLRRCCGDVANQKGRPGPDCPEQERGGGGGNPVESGESSAQCESSGWWHTYATSSRLSSTGLSCVPGRTHAHAHAPADSTAHADAARSHARGRCLAGPCPAPRLYAWRWAVVNHLAHAPRPGSRWSRSGRTLCGSAPRTPRSAAETAWPCPPARTRPIHSRLTIKMDS